MLQENRHYLLHSSFKEIKQSGLAGTPNEFVTMLLNELPETSSLMMPAFTYSFKKSAPGYEIFDVVNTPSKVGVVAETFRCSHNVIRSCDPTHSFCATGAHKNYFDQFTITNAPLGKGSILDKFAQMDNAYVILCGTDFSSFTLLHYIEYLAELPWLKYNPWEYLGVLAETVSQRGTFVRTEIPGCSKSFTKAEKILVEYIAVNSIFHNTLRIVTLNVQETISLLLPLVKSNPRLLLCDKGTCKPCDTRHKILDTL